MKQTVPESIRRLLALLLCAVMLLPNFTVLARAEEPVDGSEPTENVETIADEVPLAVIYAASDFQPQNDDEEAGRNAGKDAMAAIVDAMIEAGYTDVDGAFLCGDYSHVGDTWTKGEIDAETYNNKGVQAVADILNTKWSLTSHLTTSDADNTGDDVVYIQGNHDPVDTIGLDASGANDSTHYGVYVLHEDDFPWKQGYDTNSGNTADDLTVVQQTANKLEAYLKAKVAEKYDQPIFVLSHVPLHYGWRTYKDTIQDNIYAKYVFDVLNDYGSKLNIIFLFGHNHSNTYDDYLGGSAIYLPAGQSLLVPTTRTAYEKKTLTFTYMNAGYLGYYGGECEASATNGLSSTVFEIYEDRVEVARYDAEGEANLKDKGVKASADTWSGAKANTTIYTNADGKIELIKPAVDMVYGTLSSGMMAVGNTGELTVRGLYNTTYDVTWSSSDESIISVEGNGMSATLTANAVGEATITAVAKETGVETRAVGDETTLSYTIEVVDDAASVAVELIPAGTYTWFQKVDKVEIGKTYAFIDIEDEGYLIGQQEALHFNNNIDANKEGDIDVAADTKNNFQELNASGEDVFQLPVGGELLTLSDITNENCWWVADVAKESGNTGGTIRTYKNRTYNYLFVIEGDSDFLTRDKDQDRLAMGDEKEASSTGGAHWYYDSEHGLVTNHKTDGFQFALYYSQANTDFSAYRINHNGAHGDSKFNEDGTLADEQPTSRVYAFEQTSFTLDKAITAQLSDITGYVNKDVGYTDDKGKRRGGAQTGDSIILNNGAMTVEIPVTIDMLSGSFDVTVPGTYENLTLTYAGKVISTTYTLVVNESATILKNHAAREYMDSIYKLVTKWVPGRQYLIVDTNEAGIGHAMGVKSGKVTAHNVLVQEIPVDGSDVVYIDSTRYSDKADDKVADMVGRGITDQGNINEYLNKTITKQNYYDSISLVWTVTKRFFPTDGSPEISDVRDKDYSFLQSQMQIAGNIADRTLYIGANARDTQLKLGSQAEISGKETGDSEGTSLDWWWELWQYSKTAGVHLAASQARFAYLFYNAQNIIGNTADGPATKNFQTGMATDDGDDTVEDADFPMTAYRRVWIYERVTNIDTISARISDKTSHMTVRIPDVSEGTHASTFTGDYILVDTTHADGTVTTEQVPVHINMLSGDYDLTTEGTYPNLTVTYQGQTVCTDYTLIIDEYVANDYPEFPDEGAVKINKKADTTTYDYLETGVATIDLSVTGIPAQSGVNLVVIIDASSSMQSCPHGTGSGYYAGKTCTSCGGTIEYNDTRMGLMEGTLESMLEQLKEPINGYAPDVDVAIATFNGYTNINTSYEFWHSGLNEDNKAGNTLTHSEAQQIQEHRVDASQILLPFTNIADVDPSFKNVNKDGRDIDYSPGTNYDRAMELAYELLKEKQEQDAVNGITRDAVVVFMSDGAPYQFNYFHGDPNISYWATYLQGKLTASSEGVTSQSAAVQSAFAKYNNTEGKHWMAEAIKGDPNETYKIIDRHAMTTDHITEINGLGATMYSVGFSLAGDHMVTKDICEQVLKDMATSESHYLPAKDGAALEAAFSKIAGEIRSAGDAVFTDQLGSHFDLVTANIGRHIEIDPETGAEILVDAPYETPPFIEVKEYELYKRSEIGKTVNGVKVTEEMVGTRKPVAPKVVEKITFNDNGTVITSTLKSGNILDGDIIKASTFFYNTNKSDTINIDPDGDGVADVALLPETFYWNIGDVPQNELVLTYCVYLEDSMQGNQVSGTYNTNEFAKLNYVNYLGHDCELEVPSPKLPWNQGTVGYAFYLVDRYGRPIINQTSGETGSFAQSVRITNPVYEDFMLNNDEDGNVNAEIVAKVVLPNGYSLFDESAVYNVTLLSTGAGSYHVMGDTSLTRTTYVEGVADVATLPEFNVVNTENFVTSNTVVWFAVVADVSAIPDTVVIDYGLPVDIHVLANDTMLGDNGKLTYVGDTSAFAEGYNAAKANNSDLELWQYLQGLIAEPTAKLDSTTVNGNYGVAAMQYTDGKANGLVRYTLNQTNGMQMDREEVFVYAVNYNGGIGTHGYYYSTLTVIPATTIYYEDSFVTLSVYDYSNMSKPLGLNAGETDAATKAKMWQPVGETDSDATQAEDRPGEFSISNIDANNIYGYDQAYANADKYSLGSAQKVTVGTHADGSETFAIAEFRFTGTGFDVISLTSNMTGTITVDVIKPENFDKDSYMATAEKSFIVDTYYGYTYGDSNGDGKNEWYVNDKAADSLYQVPVMQVNDLPYGTYHVVITAAFADEFAHSDNTTYDFYLDAIRIYDPANDGNGNEVIEDAYVADKEGWPEYHELRNLLISSQDFDQLNAEDQINGIIFIDGNGALDGTAKVADYQNYGPNNELYLAPGQAVSFVLGKDIPAATLEKIAAVSLGMKSVGGSAEVKIYNAGAVNASLANTAETVVGTATDMYYDISEMIGKTVVIYNSGEKDDAILSLTNIKITYKTQPKEAAIQAPVEVNKQAVNVAMASFTVQSAPEEEVPEIPEIPETTAPTEPSEPDPFEPEVSVKLSKDSVKTGTKITVTVTTSGDVDSVVINGVEVNSFKTDRRTQKRTWTTKLSWNEAGEQNVTVIARNEEGAESEPVVKTVTVTGKSGNNGGSGSGFGGFGGFGGFDWMTDLLGRLFGRG